MRRVIILLAVALVMVPIIVLPVLPAEAAPVAFVTGGGAREHFSFAGRVLLFADGTARGFFQILVHPAVPDGTTVAVTCAYGRFDNVSIAGNVASFHSVGKCRALLSNGRMTTFTSDNTFFISDGGQPGAGADAIDVNFVGASGVSVPGGFLASGNFVVSGP